MGASYHPPRGRGNVRPALKFVSIDDLFPEPPSETEEGTLRQVWVKQRSEGITVHWSASTGFRADHRGNPECTRLNGLPIGTNAPLACGDIVRLEDRFFRVDIEGERPAGTLEQASWTVVEKLLSGGLLVKGGDRGALELELHVASPRALHDFERCPLAFEVKHLDVVVASRPDRWVSWRPAVGSLAGRAEFVLPRFDADVPQPQRLAPLVDLTLDGAPLSLDVPVCLVEEAGRLVPTHRVVPEAPRLFRDGAATVYEGRSGTGLVTLLLEGQRLGLNPARFTRVLMPGEVWRLVTTTGTQVLRVTPAASRPTPGPRGELHGLKLRGVTLHGFVRQPVDALEPLETFREVMPGRFVSDFGEEYAGEAFFEPSSAFSVKRPHLLLPAPSPFFAGEVQLPAGGLDETGLRVFADSLHEAGDGAALAVDAFVAASSAADRGRAFLELLRNASSRTELATWALRAFSTGASVPAELTATTVDEALAVLRALARNEPVFGAVNRLTSPHDLDVLRSALLDVVTNRGQSLEVWLDLGGGEKRQVWPASLKELNGFWPDEPARPLINTSRRRRKG
jgi:hypothetical protein